MIYIYVVGYVLLQDSPAENVINWDIKRTYVGHDYFQDEANKAALYKISKAYSIYDEEVGYCQGFSFMAAVLLLQVKGLQNYKLLFGDCDVNFLATFSVCFRKCQRRQPSVS